MTGVASTLIADVNLACPTECRITNLTVPLANTEIGHLLWDRVRDISFSVRGSASKLQYTLTSGETGTKYRTLYLGSEAKITGVLLSGKSLFLQSDRPGVVVEIEEWR